MAAMPAWLLEELATEREREAQEREELEEHHKTHWTYGREPNECPGCLEHPAPECAACGQPAELALLCREYLAPRQMRPHSMSLCSSCYDVLSSLRRPGAEPLVLVPLHPHRHPSQPAHPTHPHQTGALEQKERAAPHSERPARMGERSVRSV